MLLGTPASRDSAPSTRTATAPSAADSAISGEIRSRLNADGELADYAIGVSTTGGRVTLSGTVGSYPLRDRAHAIARDTNGVLRVDNRIVVNTNL